MFDIDKVTNQGDELETYQTDPFNFDEVIDRVHTGSLKWDSTNDFLKPEHSIHNPLPMWVADMDFKVAPVIQEHIIRNAQFGVYGYGYVPASFREAVINWQKNKFGWEPEASWIVQTPGVVNALNMAIQAYTQPGDSILIQSPVYFHFHADIEANGRVVTNAPLKLSNNRYVFDAKAFEAAIRPDTKLFILCNPHNPTGNVWSYEELTLMANICLKYGIIIISDEVHQDLIFNPNKKHIPLPLISDAIADQTIVCTAPSKTFNLAGLQCSNIFIQNQVLRDQFKQQCAKAGNNMVNTFGVIACEAAYRYGQPWLDALLKYLKKNRDYFSESIQNSGLPLKVIESDSLYLLWIDCRELNLTDEQLIDLFIKEARVWLDPGIKFGLGGNGFMRINLACPLSVIKHATKEIINTVNTFKTNT
ncbi:MalY/PatB family protein [Acinetobacter nosocomialis]|uniref:MalY/PatB family protein n=1 Tax=Acinetobacter nosocomialis TaxID=106654 RepID=UPI0026F438B6|nr:MalY/PatB family protein [Acinetobacter nosocomialis]MDO7435648.1 MalY/PatB family protein [Acinetobacter nosocomialis]